MGHFIDTLIAGIHEKRSHVVVGLDPVYDKLPGQFKTKGKPTSAAAARSILDFNRELIDKIHPYVPAVKPQIAFYECFGVQGIRAYQETVRHSKRAGLTVIGDVKRGDIGSTAAAYSSGHMGRTRVGPAALAGFDVDAVTVNPFFGTDGIQPFLEDSKRYGKGMFILVKTSNPSSPELQDLVVCTGRKRRKLHEVIAELVDRWGAEAIGTSGYSSVGAVVAANSPQVARVLRKLMPRSYFLVPGYGFQGGTAADVVSCFNEDGHGALVAASRSVDYAFLDSTEHGPEAFAEAARHAVVQMNEAVNGALRSRGCLSW